jgi:hypothetical protein
MLQIAIIRMLSIYYQEFIFVFVFFSPQDVCNVMFALTIAQVTIFQTHFCHKHLCVYFDLPYLFIL